MKKTLIIMCIIYCTAYNGIGQYLTSTAKDLYVLANNYAQSNWNTNAKIVSIETSNVDANGGSASWRYRNNVLGNQGDYLVTGWYNYVTGLPQFQGNIDMSVSGINYMQLELTIMDSDQAISVAEANGGNYIRANYSNVTCYARVYRKPNFATPVWYFQYKTNGVRLMDITINAMNGIVLNLYYFDTYLHENFESGSWPPNYWYDPDFGDGSFWSLSNLPYMNYCAKYSFYNSPVNETGYLYTPLFQSVPSGTKLGFLYSYATYTNELDMLYIYGTADSWDTYFLIDEMNGGPNVGSGMVTSAPTSTSYSPTTIGQWGVKDIIIPAGTNGLLFLTQSAYGNNLYVDEISVYYTTTILSSSENITKISNSFQINVFPNPCEDLINIEVAENTEAVDYQIKNLLGINVTGKTRVFSQMNGLFSINVSNLPKGFYLLEVIINEKTSVNKFQKL